MGKFTKQWNERKPEKPKRPLSSFAQYVLNYSRTAPECVHGPQLFQEAAFVWGGLSNEEKAWFTDQDAVETYQKALAEYRQKSAAMKQPASSFGLYVRHYWKTKNPRYNGRRKQFGSIQKRIAEDWKDLSQEEKCVFGAASDYLKALFEKEQNTVLNGGRDIDLNWQDTGMEDMNAALYKEPRDRRQSQEQVNRNEQQGEEEMVVEVEEVMNDYDEEFDRIDYEDYD